MKNWFTGVQRRVVDGGSGGPDVSILRLGQIRFFVATFVSALLMNGLSCNGKKTYAVRRKNFIATDNFRTDFGQMRRSVIDIIFHVEIFAVLLIFLSIISSSVLEVKYLDKLLVFLWVRTDLFLHTYEYEFIITTMKGDITRALQFNKTFRYIDNLLCVNNDNFNKHINEIYPSELILKNTTTTPSETSYLDTTLNIGEGNGTVRISVYDKREDFNFKIVNFPYLDSNIPRNPAYGVYISQLVRYARICSRKDDFIYRHRRLSLKLQQQGYKYQQLIKSFHKFYRSHSDELKKFGTTLMELRSSI